MDKQEFTHTRTHPHSHEWTATVPQAINYWGKVAEIEIDRNMGIMWIAPPTATPAPYKF